MRNLNFQVPVLISDQTFRTQSYEKIDEKIVFEVDKATSEDSQIWTCPDFNRREYLHCFFQYPAMMVPVVQKKLIEIVRNSNPAIQNMIDPFMGSATTMVACMENGLNCFGQDINPLSILIANVRTGPYLVKEIDDKQNDIISKIHNDNLESIEVNFPGLYKWFKPNVASELSKIVRSIKQENNVYLRRFFWVILAETVRLTSNDRTSTFKLHMRPQEEIDKRNQSPIEVFETHLKNSFEDYKLHVDLLKRSNQLENGIYKGRVDVRLCNSKDWIYSPSDEPFYELLVTSPPYGDNKTTVTYGQHSYLPLQWIDMSDIDSNATNDFLRTTSEIDNRALGGSLANIDYKALNALFEVSPSAYKVYLEIRSKGDDKYKKVAAFLLDFLKTLDNIFAVMKKDSYQIWTIGNRCVGGVEIPNDQILQDLVENKGGKLIKKVEREIINKRMARRNKDSSLMNYEDILIFRKLG